MLFADDEAELLAHELDDILVGVVFVFEPVPQALVLVGGSTAPSLALERIFFSPCKTGQVGRAHRRRFWAEVIFPGEILPEGCTLAVSEAGVRRVPGVCAEGGGGPAGGAGGWGGG